MLISRNESASKRLKVGLLTSKIMARTLRDARVIIYFNYFLKERLINGEYYANIFDQFEDALTKKTTAFGPGASIPNSNKSNEGNHTYR